MNKETLIATLFRDIDESKKFSAIRQLEGFLSETDVILALCLVALQTESHELRSSIIQTLKGKADKVNPYFAHMAVNAGNATLRKWALVNLSLMECRSAKAAVISGLRDSSRLVQQAAALNIGLYRDADFLKEVEKFFERNSSIEILFDSLDTVPLSPNKDPSPKKQR